VLFEQAIELALPQLPPVPPVHPSAAAILQFLAGHPDGELGEMALALGLSYSRMSHLFTQAVGLPFRVCQTALRMRSAGHQFAQRPTLTDIAHSAGFSDSAHLSHLWRRWYGLTPSYVRDDHCVQVIR
jgi:AraC family transcriptional regulator of arabinose operon